MILIELTAVSYQKEFQIESDYWDNDRLDYS